ncbi:MAG: Flp family type IVb pilin [Acetobacteraceae bacterium]|jgi:pilus assembly protein Flp/PilA
MFAYTSTLTERAKAELMLLRSDRKGVTALEYGLLAGLIAVVIIAGATLLGTNINALFSRIAGELTGVAT